MNWDQLVECNSVQRAVSSPICNLALVIWKRSLHGHGSTGRMYSLPSLGLEGTASWRYSFASYGSLGGVQNGGVGCYGSLSNFSTSRAPAGGLPGGVAKSGSTVEVTIPNKSVGSILGRGGSNISQIREISGAKVKLHESKPGVIERDTELSPLPSSASSCYVGILRGLSFSLVFFRVWLIFSTGFFKPPKC